MGASADRDVVLLNSGTEVTPGWVDKLQRSAYSSPKIATATPFSNDATICSIPRSLQANFIPTGHDPLSFGATVERRSLRQYPRIPTGVGFCIFIKRESLKQVGMFDERRFNLAPAKKRTFACAPMRRVTSTYWTTPRFLFALVRGARQKPRERNPARNATNASTASRISAHGHESSARIRCEKLGNA